MSPEDLDAAMTAGAGWPMGPCTLVDLVGIDVHVHASEALYEKLREPRMAPPPRIVSMRNAGLLGRKSGRGFYEDGIWAEGGFIPYQNIGGLTWREGERQGTLVLIYRMRQLARRLVVPDSYYGAARRLLRDKIAAHDIHFTGKPLDLGVHDERDDV